jgi:hypothetical protein
MIWIWVCLIIRSFEISPGGIYSTEFALRHGDTANFTFEARGLTPGARYELRVSWPGTAPIHNHFRIDEAISFSDEKAVFLPLFDFIRGSLGFEASGITNPPSLLYTIPVNVSLERQYLGLTIHVWKLIAILLPVLIFANFAVLRFFPASLPDPLDTQANLQMAAQAASNPIQPRWYKGGRKRKVN